MSDPSSPPNATELAEAPVPTPSPASDGTPTDTSSDPLAERPANEAAPKPRDSYVKLAMRNMVRKRGKSLFHFALTTIALLMLLVGLSYLTR